MAMISLETIEKRIKSRKLEIDVVFAARDELHEEVLLRARLRIA